jgi:hypothetical protein
MSETNLIPVPGSAVKLIKFPPNRGMMDWDRVLRINQIGRVVKTHFDGKTDPLYQVWFSSRNGHEGYEVWLASEHIQLTHEKEQFSG